MSPIDVLTITYLYEARKHLMTLYMTYSDFGHTGTAVNFWTDHCAGVWCAIEKIDTMIKDMTTQ